MAGPGRIRCVKGRLAGLKRSQIAEIQACEAALCALAQNSGDAQVAQFIVDLIRDVPMEDKKRLLMHVCELPPFPDATVLLELVDHKVLDTRRWADWPRPRPSRRSRRTRGLAGWGQMSSQRAQVLRELATVESAPALVEVIGRPRTTSFGAPAWGRCEGPTGQGMSNSLPRSTKGHALRKFAGTVSSHCEIMQRARGRRR